MTDSRTEAWLILTDSGLSAPVLNRALAALGGPEELLGSSAGAMQHEGGLSRDQVERLSETAADRVRRRRQFEVMQRHAIRIIEPRDTEWPARLDEVEGAPPCLFIRGQLLADDRLAVAMVGPRMATPYGKEVARRLAAEFAPMMTVISGLALGIDSAAHKATIENGGRTIGVAACGLDEDYPQGNAPLREAIPEAGALLSPWPPMTKSRRHFFPHRNVLIAALSLAVIVVEASDKSGALHTAKAAVDLGRELFAVPGDITRLNSRGTNGLIAQGAGVCTSARDVIAAMESRLTEETHELRAQQEEEGAAAETDPADGLSAPEQALLDAIRHTEQPYDDLLAQFVPEEMDMGTFTGAVLQLEMKGLVHQEPGRVLRARV